MKRPATGVFFIRNKNCNNLVNYNKHIRSCQVINKNKCHEYMQLIDYLGIRSDFAPVYLP
jgi:hypothetical protein